LPNKSYDLIDTLSFFEEDSLFDYFKRGEPLPPLLLIYNTRKFEDIENLWPNNWIKREPIARGGGDCNAILKVLTAEEKKPIICSRGYRPEFLLTTIKHYFSPFSEAKCLLKCGENEDKIQFKVPTAFATFLSEDPANDFFSGLHLVKFVKGTKCDENSFDACNTFMDEALESLNSIGIDFSNDFYERQFMKESRTHNFYLADMETASITR
jgi:hypothetical protein